MAGAVRVAQMAGGAMNHERLRRARDTARAHLLAQRNAEGFWDGHLASSALSTATAVAALALVGSAEDHDQRSRGVAWLLAHANADGGWGDTTASPSNLPTTLLALAALRLMRVDAPTAGSACAERLAHHQPFAEALTHIYGDDHTFAVPIRLTCALAGLMPWEGIPALPVELAALPRWLFPLLRLEVVSYALPALIGVGLGVHAHAPPSLAGRLRTRLSGRVLERLGKLQPEHGGFLDATPLTSFVALGLAAAEQREHAVTLRCRHFLRQAQRADGAWPIDTDLSVWLTTASITALAPRDQTPRIHALESWLLALQQRSVHPYTGAAPGGWAWTWRAGGVPDADDTAGALLALRQLRGATAIADDAVRAGCRWLVELQNRDGGWPTFCRGWGRLAFDRSAPDLTAHVLRALTAWPDGDRRSARAIRQGFSYLAAKQRGDGAWVPLWFGNQHAPHQDNPVLGTARVLRAYDHCADGGTSNVERRTSNPTDRALTYLLSTQLPSGAWGGAAGVVASVEETALAITALHPWRARSDIHSALTRAGEWLMAKVEDGSWTQAAPIGLYFAKLWYDEALYPVVWTTEALTLLAGDTP